MAESERTPPAEVESVRDVVPTILRRALAEGRGLTRIKERLASELTLDSEEVLRRWSELPDLDPTAGPHVPLLLEARELYRHGHFYSCVAMCGIASERIVKDILGEGLAVRKDEEGESTKQAVPLPDEAIAELDRFELSAIARFLVKAGLLVPEARKAVLDLAQLRNRYAHGSGMKSPEDALKAIGLLHDVVNRTVSFFANSERFGSAPQMDTLVGAVGSFGIELTNPIPGDYIQYCAELRCPSGHPYVFKRRGSVGVAPDGHIIDRISLLCVGNEHRVDLVFDVYHAGISTATPDGLGRGTAAGTRLASGPGPLKSAADAIEEGLTHGDDGARHDRAGGPL